MENFFHVHFVESGEHGGSLTDGDETFGKFLAEGGHFGAKHAGLVGDFGCVVFFLVRGNIIEDILAGDAVGVDFACNIFSFQLVFGDDVFCERSDTGDTGNRIPGESRTLA